MGRIRRGISIMKQSMGLLRQDKELMVLPVLSGLAIGVVIASFFFGMGLHKSGGDIESVGEVPAALAAFAMYVITYTIAFFFQAALVAGACERMRGGDPTLGSALGAAGKRFGTIVMWAVLAATVGMILRSIQERSAWLGKIVVGLLGAAWSLATFFVVPVIVMEERGVNGSVRRSWDLFKKTWGENVTGQVGIGVVGLLLMLPVVLVAGLLAMASPVVGIVVGVVGVALLSVFLSALQGIFVAALYRYATEDQAPEGFSREQIAGVFA